MMPNKRLARAKAAASASLAARRHRKAQRKGRKPAPAGGKPYDPSLHPKDSKGRFIAKPGAAKANDGPRAATPKGESHPHGPTGGARAPSEAKGAPEPVAGPRDRVPLEAFADQAAAIQEAAIRSRDLSGDPRIVAAMAPKDVDLSKLIPPVSKPFADPHKLLAHGPFDWAKYSPIEVETDGRRFWVMSGMTRIENARRAGITKLPAYIFRRS